MGNDVPAPRSLHVAVNARFLLPGDSLEGIGRFSYEMLRRIAVDHPEHTFHLLFDRAYDKRYLFSPNVVPHVLWPPARHPILYVAWFEVAVAAWLRRNKPDVFVSTDGHTTLSTTVPRVTVFHDLAFEHSRRDVDWLQLRYYRTFFRKFAERSTRVAAVSAATRDDLVVTYGVNESDVRLVSNAVDDHFRPSDETARTAARLKFSDGLPYFVFVGALQPRKNLVNLLAGFDLFKETDTRDTQLVLVGRIAWRTRSMKRAYDTMKNRDSVRFIGRVSEEELVALYGAAVALAYVPFREGFGIPVIEAQACACPVITSNCSSLPEVAGEGAVLVDPRSVADIARGLSAVADDPELAQRLVAAGLLNTKRFDWQASSEALWQEVLAAAAESARPTRRQR